MEKESNLLKNEKDLKVVVDYIKGNFDNTIKNILKELWFLSTKVAEVHWPIHKELIVVDNVFKEFSFIIENHLDKKEKYFFPMISDRNIQNNNLEILDFIEKSKKINNNFLLNLEKLRNLTDNYKIPEGACKTYTKLLTNLLELDQILIRYIDIENKIFFPLILSKLESL